MEKTKKIIFYLYQNSLIRFLFVGGLGTIINLIIFFISADLLGIEKNISSILAFIIALTQNYILNHSWSFKKYIDTQPISIRGYSKYFLVNILGLSVNLVVLNMIDYYFNLSYMVIAQFFGISAGTILNYLGSKFFVFIEIG